MNKLLYFSGDEVQSQLAAKYNLLVHIGLESFQYAIVDTARDEVKVLAEYEIPTGIGIKRLIGAIEGLPEAGKQFKFSFNSIKVSFDTSNYTFIPAEIYLDDNQQEYGKYLNLSATGKLLVNNIPSAEIKNVVAIDSELDIALNRIFQKPKIYNQAVPFLEGIQKILSREDDLVCFIDVQPRHFQASLLKDFKLEFYNSFEFANADEFNYYLLSLIQSLNLQTGRTQIVLSGKIAETDEVYKRLQKYFDDIRFIDSQNQVNYPEQSGEVRPHTYFTLISLNLCE